ncbi:MULTISPECIES: MazG-like family protein [Chryseobacterium]|uniref:Uncharacterized protein n=1 Tax=Candidatus Chryseobacterium massiliense TaxID=204089 RepID=A0A3D9B3R3_9FLAO|nr:MULTISPECIES: MazG-like family protein [Chryseobacterium]REC47852.1 hypothetical protein DRF68_12485 [Candidatus Chryseobacterium massiliae]
MENIINEIRAERKAQDRKWGQQDHTPIEWIAILTEEVGEASKEAVDFHFYNGLSGRGQVEIRSIQFERLQAYRKELIQVAAVSVSMIESLDRYLQDIVDSTK